MPHRKLLMNLGFVPKENTSGVFTKKYSLCGNYSIDVDLDNGKISYGELIKKGTQSTLNLLQAENWVVLECVNRLLEKGYKPENITLEKVYPAGHGFSGRLDICVSYDDGSEYLLIECKTYGKEFDKAVNKLKKDGGQLFTYFKFSNKADIIMLYASELNNNKVIYKSEIIKIEDDYRTGDVKDFYDKWNKLTKDNGVFDSWVSPYQFLSKALTLELLEPIKQEDSSFIFNRFKEILRHNVVSDLPNAFNKIFTLFLCKIYDEKVNEGTENELGFQWNEGLDDDISFQLRLTDLYKNGMFEFLEKKVTDFSETEFENKFKSLDDSVKTALLTEFKKIRLEKNNEFAIKEVYDEKSFKENAKVVKEVVELLQGYKIRYTKKQQYLSDFFELLLTTGLKQESGQFFTPVPVAQFIIKSLPIDSIVEDKLHKGEANNLLPFVMDYAAGSGHFLTEAMHEIQRLIDQKDDKKYSPGIAKKIRNWKDDHFDWALDYIYGIEKDYRLVKVGKVGCYLHGDGLANVLHTDGLANFNHPDYKGKLKHRDKDFPIDNKEFEIIVSNPPYSVSAFKNASREYYRENDFSLYDKLTDNSSEIECLFIERTKQLLKDGGVAGIILPSSILGNAGLYSKSREIILQYFDIIAIAELGSNTFMATGTNTVTLFLRRRNNYESINLKIAVGKFFTNLKDVTLSGIENPVTKYVEYVWGSISFYDYISLLQKTPNNTIKEHELYIEYRKKIKAKNEMEFWNILIEIEKEKLFYFIIVLPQNIVLIKSGEKDAEKRFLGYEFSYRRGSEGIHSMQRGKSIEDCTVLFDSNVFDNPTKASTYIYKAFNADFDGDQMAVHVPLGHAAVLEAQILMLASHNILNPANGAPITVPSQDMVLGLYYMTKGRKSEEGNPAKGENSVFYSVEEVVIAYNEGKVDLHAWIKVLWAVEENGITKKQLIETTVGRALFNQVVPQEYGYINELLTKKSLRDIISNILKKTGTAKTAKFLDDIKDLGFTMAFRGGLSFNLGDVIVPEIKEKLVDQANAEVDEVMSNYNMGFITNNERYNQIIDIWTHTNSHLTQMLMQQLSKDKQGFNPVYMMLDSGARGSKEQIRQLSGMRGLMAKPTKSGSVGGEIIENPILSNFKEGLSVLEYFISTHGARKGLADTALKTADAGYLTRRLVDVAQDVIISEEDCGTLRGLTSAALKKNEETVESLYDRILGRVSLHDIYHPHTGTLLASAGLELTEDICKQIEDL